MTKIKFRHARLQTDNLTEVACNSSPKKILTTRNISNNKMIKRDLNSNDYGSSSQARLEKFHKTQQIVSGDTVKKLQKFKKEKKFSEAKKLIESTMKSIGDFGNIKVVRYGNMATVNVGDEKIFNNPRFLKLFKCGYQEIHWLKH